MLDNHYTDRALVQLYDVLNASRSDTDFYLSLAGADTHRILDVGCGTGALACEYAKAGYDVTGLDPASEMLRVARERPYGDHVHWIQGDACTGGLDGTFDLIVMTGHVFQVFLTDAATLVTLNVVCEHLSESGLLAFGSRNPLARQWETWTPERTRGATVLPEAGELRGWTELNAVEEDRVTFTHHYEFLSREETRTSRSTIRFPAKERIHALLHEAGLAVEACFGFWDRRPYAEDSPEIITLAMLD